MFETLKEKIRIQKLVSQRHADYSYIKHFVGPKLTIRNGYGFGFVSDEFIYNNGYLELGFGKIRSGYGDWGGGATHSVTTPLKIIIDRDLNIIKKESDSFYNAENPVEKDVEKILKMLGYKLNLNNDFLYSIIFRAFTIQQLKQPISINFINTNDKCEVRRMLEFAERNFKEQS